MSSPSEAKLTLRTRLRAELKAQPSSGVILPSADLCGLVKASSVWQTSHAVLLFAPMPSEPDISPLLADALASGKLLALPRFNVATKTYEAVQVTDLARDLVVGSFQLREPSAACSRLALNRLDLALVPGLGFDARGHRLGRGKGYYDRLLAGFSGVKVGVAFDFQVVPEVPVEPHDIALDAVVTPTRWIEAKRA
ncbi:MAG: 5-formyltetrahydrofolate cyclo-ligase [Proteobacteria bacterium]|nr:5-formyltetrahydrofolate cyclo-ligase [Pseudomonadota bacterium]